MASQQRRLLTSEAFLLAGSEVMFSKKSTFCGQKGRMRQETLVTGVSGTTFFPSFFLVLNTVLTDDREEDGALSKYSSWKSMRFFSEESPTLHCSIVHNSVETMQ